MFKFPIKYYDDNIIFTEDGCYGAFEIKDQLIIVK